jgi:hypothetical protein
MYKRHNITVGRVGEKFVTELLKEFDPQPGPPGDVFTLKTSIEVKTARPDSRGRWQFCLNRHGKETQAKFFVFVLLTPRGKEPYCIYMIPAPVLSGKKKVTIPSEDYKGKYIPFYQIDFKLIQEVCR